VRYIDDSVATNTHATLAAIASFKQPIVLIAGGRNKGIDLSPLRDAADRLRAVIAIGEAAEEVKRLFEPTSVFVPIAGSIGEAVAMATQQAQPGDVVLLSPACASHDWFRNYAERGDAFVDACVRAGVVA
jgi:UDP-N-acetylmuramoylalanine--D-glutamate ligase